MEIKSRKVILVEGRADEAIIQRLLPAGSEVDVVRFKEEGTLSNVVGAVAADGVKLGGLEAVGIVIDADENPQRSWQSATDALARNELPAPEKAGVFTGSHPKIGVFVVPDLDSPGSLETLLRRSVADRAEADCAESYLECVEAAREGERWSTRNRRDKAFAFAYFAVHADPTDDLVVAARKSLWAIESEAFEPLKRFIVELASGGPPPDAE